MRTNGKININTADLKQFSKIDFHAFVSKFILHPNSIQFSLSIPINNPKESRRKA